MMTENDPLRGWSFYDTASQLYASLNRQLEAALRGARAEKEAVLASGDGKRLADYRRRVLDAFLRSVRHPAPPAVSAPADCGMLVEERLCVRKIRYETEDGARIPALVYAEKGRTDVRPGVLFLCGHEPDGKQSARYQEVCRILALHGFVVLCPEIAGQGERAEGGPEGLLPPTAAHNAAGIAALAGGSDVAHHLLRDAMAAVTVLRGLPQVDAERIAVTGNSGGGLQSIMLAMADARIQAAAVGTFLSGHQAIFRSGKPQDAEQVWRNTISRDAVVDHDDLLWAFAPKPLMILAAQDDFFPYEGTLDAYASAKQAYAALGVESRLTLYSEAVSHQYTHGMAHAAARFFAGHFGFASAEPEGTAVWSVKGRQLWCAKGGGATLKGRCTPTVPAVNRGAVAGILPEGPLPMRKQADAFAWHGLPCQRLLYDAGNGLYGVLALFHMPQAEQTGECRLFLWEGGTRACAAHHEEIWQSCRAGHAVAVCDLPAMGTATPQPVNQMPPDAPLGTLYLLNTWLLRMGKSLAALRTEGLVRAAALLRKEYGLPVALCAPYPYRLYGRYARLAGADIAMDTEDALDFDLLWTQLAAPVPDNMLWGFVLPDIFAPERAHPNKP